MKLCKDCRWAQAKGSLRLLRRYDLNCMHPTALVPQHFVDYVYGELVEPRRLRCIEARNDREYCGPDGRYWEELVVGFGDR